MFATCGRVKGSGSAKRSVRRGADWARRAARRTARRTPRTRPSWPGSVACSRPPARSGACSSGSRTPTGLDFTALVSATFKAARTIARDEVTKFIRAPFVEGEPTEGDEKPVDGGYQQALGELVTCSRCVGTWVAAGLGSAQIWRRAPAGC